MIYGHPTIWTILEARRQSVLIASAKQRASAPERFLAGLRKTWKQARDIRAARLALARLNQQQVRDIGVAPGTIDSVARALVLAHLTVAGLDHRDGRSGPF